VAFRIAGAEPSSLPRAAAAPRWVGASSRLNSMVNPVVWLIVTLIDIYFWIILITVIMSWLIAFNVMNGQNPYVRQVNHALRRLTEPLLAPIRRFLPDLGGIDISPIVLLIGLQFLRYIVIYYGSGLA
jgi:YggT family protein